MSLQPHLHVPLIQLKDAEEVKFLPAKDNRVGVCTVYPRSEGTKVCLDFLEKVFNAVNLNLKEQTASFKLEAGEGFSLALHPAFKQYKIWIGFGVAPKNLGLQFEYQKYQPITFQGHTFLWADNPTIIMADPNLKKLLWVSLQKLFPKDK